MIGILCYEITLIIYVCVCVCVCIHTISPYWYVICNITAEGVQIRMQLDNECNNLTLLPVSLDPDLVMNVDQ